VKILVISSGNIVQLAGYARHFAQQGHSVVFINPTWQNKLCGRTVADEFGGLDVTFYSWFAFEQLREYPKFDCIFGTQHGAAQQVLRYQRQFGIPALLQILDIADESMPDVLARQLPFIKTYFEITRLTGINPAIPKQITALTGRTDCGCVFYPVDIRTLEASPVRRAEDYVLIISRNAGFKRVDLAIRACAHAKKPLVLVTQDDKKHTLHRLAESLGVAAKFYPLAADNLKAALLRRCKLHIFTQMWAEAPCIPSAEALYCKKPSIIFDYPAQRAIEGGHSVYVEPGDWLGIGKAILDVYKDYGAAVKQAEAGHAWVVANLAPDVVADQILSTLENMV
jgi:glycosyltransferase involved in cell wall biosynthesis